MAGPHHRGTHPRRAKAVVDQANADPTTRCRRCGELARPGDPWEAGHIHDGQPDGPLAPEHRSCNRSAGARRGQLLRRARRNPTPRRTHLTW